MYTYDVAVATGSREELQRELNSWKSALDRFEIKINVSKTGYESWKDTRIENEIEGQVITRVEHLKYLWVEFHEENKQELEINCRITKYNSTLSMLYALRKQNNIPLKCKNTIYTTILRTILIYGYETRALTKPTVYKPLKWK